jgi:putative transposase
MFHRNRDYVSFLSAMERACEKLPMRVLAFCLMPNHFHLVLWPRSDGDLGRWMFRVLNAQVQAYRLRNGTIGRIWQGRFKSFPIQTDGHLLTVLRYVERNPVRANLVEAAVDWPWSSARFWRQESRPSFLEIGPVERPSNWLDWVDSAQTAAELAVLRRSVARGAPFGGMPWVEATARRLGLESSTRPRGRPPKPRNDDEAEEEKGTFRISKF